MKIGQITALIIGGFCFILTVFAIVTNSLSCIMWMGLVIMSYIAYCTIEIVKQIKND